MFSPVRLLGACLLAPIVLGVSGFAAVQIHPVDVPVTPYTQAGAYTVHVEDASNSANYADPLVHVHKVHYHRTNNGTPTGAAAPLAVPPADSTDLDLVTNVYYTHFSFGGGPVKVTVTFTKTSPTSVTLSPTHFGIPVTYSAATKTATFTISDSRYLILTANGSSAWPFKLIIIADPLETNIPTPPVHQGDGHVWDVSQAPYSADGTYTNAADGKINTAIGDAHNGGGGTVYVPAGVYKLSGPVTAQSDVSLYLAPGAYLRVADNLNTTSKLYCVQGNGVSNFKIFGRGTLDANGVAAGGHQPSKGYIPTAGYAFSGCIQMLGCTGITVDGVVLRESSIWAVFFGNTDGLTVKNTKVVNYQQDFQYYRENDGLDLISCSNSTVSHSFVFTADDALCMKGGYDSSYTKALDNCVYTDVVVYSGADGAKFGFQAWTNVQNSTFRNIEVVRGARPIAVHIEQGSATTPALCTNLAFLDVTTEALAPSATARSVDFDLRASPGPDATNVTVSNFTSPLSTDPGIGGTKAYVRGVTAGTFDNVHFTNCVLGGVPITNTNYATYFMTDHVTNLTFASAADTNQVYDITPASFSSNWKVPPGSSFGIDKINDGAATSTSEAQALDSNDAWVIWDFGTTLKNFSSSQMYQDNGTYSALSWKLERWDDPSQSYVEVFNLGSPTNGWNPGSTTPFFTTKLRVTFHPDAAHSKLVGINEVEFYGH